MFVWLGPIIAIIYLFSRSLSATGIVWQTVARGHSPLLRRLIVNSRKRDRWWQRAAEHLICASFLRQFSLWLELLKTSDICSCGSSTNRHGEKKISRHSTGCCVPICQYQMSLCGWCSPLEDALKFHSQGSRGGEIPSLATASQKMIESSRIGCIKRLVIE